MTTKEADQLRHVAHEIIIELMDAERGVALKLLRDHANRALEEVAKRQPVKPARKVEFENAELGDEG